MFVVGRQINIGVVFGKLFCLKGLPGLGFPTNMEQATGATLRVAQIGLDGVLNLADTEIQRLFIFFQTHILLQHGIPTKQRCGGMETDWIDLLQ